MVENKVVGTYVDEGFCFGDSVEEHDLICDFTNKKAFLSIEVVEKLSEWLLEFEWGFKAHGVGTFGDHLGLLGLSWLFHVGNVGFVINYW